MLFDRIFNFDPAAVARMEQRLDARYTPGAGFPLQAWLIAARAEWPATIVNVSGHGIALLVEREAGLHEGTAGEVRLRFGAHQQLVGGELVHVRAENDRLHCGVRLHFSDFTARKTYLQLLQPISIGQSLQPVAAEQPGQPGPSFSLRVFRGEGESMLSIWDEKSSGAPRRFEFQMQEYLSRSTQGSDTIEVQAREERGADGGKMSNPVFDISGTLHAEIRQLFRWTLPNLSAAVPRDVKEFLQRFAK